MRYIVFIFTILFCSQTINAQSKFSKLKDWFSPSPKSVSHHPRLDTAQVLLKDSSETFFSKHYSPDIDESGTEETVVLNTTVTQNIAVDDEEGDESDDSEDEEDLFYLDSVSFEGVVRHITLKNENEWLIIDTLYKHFDSLRVNPYRFDPRNIKDTIKMVMFDGARSWSMPLTGEHYITSKYGPRGSSSHYGTDIRLDIGDTVRSAFDGVVRISKYNPGGYGNYVMVRHYNGTETIYGHLSKRLVVVGQEVKAGELIGWGGNTGRSSGPHLHIEVRFKGIALDPQMFFDFQNDTIVGKTVNILPTKLKETTYTKNKVYHKVRRGDTLYGIARKYNVKASQICKLNKISTKTVLKVGQTIRVK